MQATVNSYKIYLLKMLSKNTQYSSVFRFRSGPSLEINLIIGLHRWSAGKDTGSVLFLLVSSFIQTQKQLPSLHSSQLLSPPDLFLLFHFRKEKAFGEYQPNMAYQIAIGLGTNPHIRLDVATQ